MQLLWRKNCNFVSWKTNICRIVERFLVFTGEKDSKICKKKVRITLKATFFSDQFIKSVNFIWNIQPNISKNLTRSAMIVQYTINGWPISTFLNAVLCNFHFEFSKKETASNWLLSIVLLLQYGASKWYSASGDYSLRYC